MNALLLSALCLLGAWAALTGGVTVQVSPVSLPWPRRLPAPNLQEPQEKLRKFAPIPGEPVVPILCSNPNFPEELKPLCKEPNAQEILQRLEEIAEDPSTCEICAYAACTGC
uniref:Guanylin n=1 Tax=Nomascus leucogenys TaxID=61853 RepID=G1RNV1_NOMLE